MPKQRARQLRQASTDAERRTWSALRDRRLLQYKLRRQHPIPDFIVYFACTEHALVIELDGGQHADNLVDSHRTTSLEDQGWRVIQFWNNDVLNDTSGVDETIRRTLKAE